MDYESTMFVACIAGIFKWKIYVLHSFPSVQSTAFFINLFNMAAIEIFFSNFIFAKIKENYESKWTPNGKKGKKFDICSQNCKKMHIYAKMGLFSNVNFDNQMFFVKQL